MGSAILGETQIVELDARDLCGCAMDQCCLGCGTTVRSDTSPGGGGGLVRTALYWSATK